MSGPVRLRLLLGGIVTQFGWLFLGFGLIFAWVFVPAADLRSLVEFRGPLERATGRITKVEQTGFTVGGSGGSSGTPVHANHYLFTVDGREHRDVSYTTGRVYEVGGEASIEYPAGRPEVSRITGTRTRPFAAWSAFVVIFPLVGLALIVPALLRGTRRVALLRGGEIGRAVLSSKRRTNVEINDEPVYRLTFLFEGVDGSVHEFETRSHLPERLEDEVEEIVLYDPRQPTRVLLTDELPDRVAVDEHGTVGGVTIAGAAACAALPLLTVIGHGAYLLMRVI